MKALCLRARQLRHGCAAVIGLCALLGSGHLALRPCRADVLDSGTWAATDALGRRLPMGGDRGVPPPRADRFIGIFYFIHQGARNADPGPFGDNVQNLVRLAPDRSNIHALYSREMPYWWGKPAVGYFLADDPWVARRNLTMLAEAGVDVVLLDLTNGPTFDTAYRTLFEAAEALRRAGIPAPAIAFVTHAHGGQVATALHDTFYAHNQYPDLWFRWEGKPLILGDPNQGTDDGRPLRPDVRGFFTWRTSWAWTPRRAGGHPAPWFGDGRDAWPWIDDWPQGYGWHMGPNVPEEVPVAIAGHPIEDLGRSFQGTWNAGGHEPPLIDARDETARTAYGDYFQQQWERALAVDPHFVFVTGWNEWTAGGTALKPGQTGALAGRPLQPGDIYFVDEYNPEFSRDAMPMEGGFGDDYYMQLVANIRRFKGAAPAPVQRGDRTLPLGAPFRAWGAITPEYRDPTGDIDRRDWPGWGGVSYRNDTGRNDIVSARVTCDAAQVYFYVRTASPLTPWNEPNWMRLLIATTPNSPGGWNGYDFVVNQHVLSANRTTVTRFSDGKTWTVAYRYQGNEMGIAVPRSLLGLPAGARTAFDFHWLDNVPVGPGAPGPDHWWYEGDGAPDGRFNYRFVHISSRRG